MIQHPVIFVHGLIVTAGAYERFTEVSDFAKENLVDFYIYKRNAGMGIEERSRQLKSFLDKFSGPFHLLCHSAGGIDARVALHKDRLEGRCLSVTTIGTPHRGTPLANYYLNHDSLFFKFLFCDEETRQVVEEMTPEAMANLNKLVPLDELPNAYSILSYVDNIFKLDVTSIKGYRYLKQWGENDGTVTVESQTFGKVIDVLYGSHKSQTFPVRFGLRPNYKDYFKLYFNFLAALEKELHEENRAKNQVSNEIC